MTQLCVLAKQFQASHSRLSVRLWRSRASFTTNFTGTISHLPPTESKPLLLFTRTHSWLQNTQYSSSSKYHQKEECDNFTPIYKLHGITFCRSISRLKIFQTALTVLLLPPVYYYYLQGQVTYSGLLYCSGTAIFACIMLYCMSYYLQRIIGMIYLNETGTTVKVSHLTFWGKRRDLFIPATDVKTFTETGDHKQETLLQFRRYSSPEVLYFTTRFGYVLNKEKFCMLFGAFK
ncbi:transmembrane protein 186 [Pelodytes ibericus]